MQNPLDCFSFNSRYGAAMLDEQNCIQEHLKNIREYLLKAFSGFNMTEDTSDPKICHRFTMSNLRTNEQFKLKVGWVRLSDRSINPELMDRLLAYGDVAGKMREEKKGQYFYWWRRHPSSFNRASRIILTYPY